MGITPYDNQSQLQVLYRYRSFNGYYALNESSKFFPQTLGYTKQNNTPNYYQTTGLQGGKIMHGGTSDPIADSSLSYKDYEVYQAIELRGKIFLHKRLEFNFILPYSFNSSASYSADTVKQKVAGISDGSYFLNYHLIRKLEEVKFKQRLIVGIGVKLPHGNYYKLNANEKRFDFLMQPGTGSTDFFFNLQYLISLKKWGLSTISMYKINGSNYYKEKIANGFTENLNVFYKISLGNTTIIPSVQAYYENTKGLYINSVFQEGTSMNMLLSGVGLDIFYKNIGFNLAYQQRVWEKQEENKLKAVGRLVVGITINFNQQKYLFGKKE
jgi:hypothetical protein